MSGVTLIGKFAAPSDMDFHSQVAAITGFVAAPQPPAPSGPGTELKRLLERFGIRPAADCQCLARAAEMDRIGPDACEARLEEIAGWLGEEAKNQGLPFLPAAGRMIVRRAIANARRADREKAQASDLAHEH